MGIYGLGQRCDAGLQEVEVVGTENEAYSPRTRASVDQRQLRLILGGSGELPRPLVATQMAVLVQPTAETVVSTGEIAGGD